MGKKDFKNTKNWRINEEIHSEILRVITDDGELLGVISRQEALKNAQERGLDLIEIAPLAQPPVAKISDFGKFRYSEEKKLKKQKQKAKVSEVKEVRFSPFIDSHDFNTRIKRVNEFLKEGNKARIVVVFKGRQMNSTKQGYDLIGEILKSITNEYVVDMEPKFLGRHLATIISPVKNAKFKSNQEKQNDKTKNQEISKEEI